MYAPHGTDGDQANAAPFSQIRLFNRPPRILRQLPAEQIEVPPPPQIPPLQRARLIMLMMPLMTAGMYILIMFFRGGSGGGLLVMIPMIGMSLIMAGIGLYNYYDQIKQQRLARQSADTTFTVMLNELDVRLEELWTLQTRIRRENAPPFAQLLQLIKAAEPRLWERRPEDADFLVLRVGIGDYPSLTTVKLQSSTASNEYTLQLKDLVKRYAVIQQVPRTISLPEIGSLGIAGADGEAFAVARALLWHLLTHHSPSDVRVAAFWHSKHDSVWQWLREVPHTQSLLGEERYRLLAHFDFNSNLLTDERRIYFEEVIQELEREVRQRSDLARDEAAARKLPYLVILLTDYEEYGAAQPLFRMLIEHGRALNISVICLVEHMRNVPSDCGAYIDLRALPTMIATAGPAGGLVYVEPDRITAEQATEAAQLLGNIFLEEHGGVQTLPRTVNLLDLLHIPDARTFDPQERWAMLPPADDDHPSGLLPTPIGRTSGSHPLVLDLNEKKQGVHGMIAGTTGSGKSELLTTLLMGLAVLHHPDRLNFMLIDFKGGATFRDLARLPHTAGFITDLSGSQAERALIAINSELDRRKQFFGKWRVPNIKSYRRLAATPSLPTMQINRPPNKPNLLIAIDEFDEMARDYPNIVDELIRVAKQGRSLGVHLLFATQQPSNGAIKPGLRTNLTYWLALRVVDPEDSKLMINSRDAAAIPTSAPGRAYMRVDDKRWAFQSAIVTLPYRSPAEKEEDAFLFVDATGRLTSPQARQRVQQAMQDEAADKAPDNSPKPLKVQTDADELMAAMERSAGAGYAAEKYRIWHAPLRSTLLLSDDVVGLRIPDGQRSRALLCIPIGLRDEPQEANQPPMELNLVESGSLMILGTSASGKTSVMRSCMLALAATHSPGEVIFYVIDAHGGGLGFVREAKENVPKLQLPHLADALRISDSTRINRLLAVLDDEVRERHQQFTRAGVESWEAYHAAHSGGEPVPAIVVLIDQLVEFVEQNGELVKDLSNLVRTAKAVGIHFIMAADRLSSSIPSDLKNSVATKFVLRLSSDKDSVDLLGKPFAAALRPQDVGRGFMPGTPHPKEFQIGFPTLRSRTSIQEAISPDSDDEQEERRLDLSSLRIVDVELPSSIVMLQQHWAKHYTGRLPDPLALLPTNVEAPYEQLIPSQVPPLVSEPLTVPLATDSRTMQPLVFNFQQLPHLMICGGPRMGKANVLRTILASMAIQYTPEHVTFYLVDYRIRSLRPFRDLPHTRGFATDQTELVALLNMLTQELEARKQQVVASQAEPLKTHLVLAISSWDLMEVDAPKLAALQQWVVRGQELGFHVVITSNDFSTATSNSFLKMLRLERTVAVVGNIEISGNNIGLPRPLKYPATMEAIPGRGFLVEGGRERFVQFWYTSETVINALPTLARPLPPQPAAEIAEAVSAEITIDPESI